MNDLLIVGAYINSIEGEEILYKALERLCHLFDIALVTHTPISERIQKQVKYFIYDHRNELMTTEISTVYWGNYPTFDYQMHPDGSRKYHSFAVYRSLTNAVKLLSADYNSFIYLEGDWFFSPNDALKLKNMKSIANEKNVQAMFISYGDFLNTNFFYSTMDFLKQTFMLFNSKEEYMDRCRQVGAHGQLENYFYRSIAHQNLFDKVYIIDGIGMPSYFPESQGNLNSSTGRGLNNAITYTTDVFKAHDELSLVFMYINHNKIEGAPDSYQMLLDGEHVTQLSTNVFSTAFEIYPKNDKFLIEIGSNKFYYDRNEILAESNKSFIKLK